MVGLPVGRGVVGLVVGRVAAVGLALVLMGGCATLVGYERGLPKRVEVTKQASPAQLRFVAERTGDGSLEIAALSTRDVKLQRRIVYNTIESRYEQGNPLWELFEVPFGVLALPIMAIAVPAGYFSLPESTTHKRNRMRDSIGLIFGWVNPFQGIVGGHGIFDPNTDREVFFSQPRATRFRVSLPRPSLAITYRIGPVGGGEGLKGQGRTDSFGRVEVRGVGRGALRVRVQAGNAEADLFVPAAMSELQMAAPATGT